MCTFATEFSIVGAVALKLEVLRLQLRQARYRI